MTYRLDTRIRDIEEAKLGYEKSKEFVSKDELIKLELTKGLIESPSKPSHRFVERLRNRLTQEFLLAVLEDEREYINQMIEEHDQTIQETLTPIQKVE